MIRDVALRNSDDVYQLRDVAFFFQQRLDDPQPDGFAQASEKFDQDLVRFINRSRFLLCYYTIS